ncbi:unnamed protein product [Malus baccata var. baccata]
MNQNNLPSFHPRTSQSASETSSSSSNESNNVPSKFQLEKKLGKRTLVDKENIEPILIENSKLAFENFSVESKTHKNSETFMLEIPSYNPFEPRPELTQQFELFSPTPFHLPENKIPSTTEPFQCSNSQSSLPEYNYHYHNLNKLHLFSPIRTSENHLQWASLAAKTESAQEIETTSVNPFPTFWSPSPRDLPAPSSLIRSCSQITANQRPNPRFSRLPPPSTHRSNPLTHHSRQQRGRVLPPWSRRV